MKLYSVGPDDLYDGDISGLDYDWLVYWYEASDYEGFGEAIGLDGDQLYVHDLSHCSCYGPMEDGGSLIAVENLESDSVLDTIYKLEIVSKVRELLAGEQKQEEAESNPTQRE